MNAAFLKQLIQLLLPLLLSLFGLGTGGFAAYNASTGTPWDHTGVLVNGLTGSASLTGAGFLLYGLRDRLRKFTPLSMSPEAVAEIELWRAMCEKLSGDAILSAQFEKQYGFKLPKDLSDLATAMDLIKKKWSSVTIK